MVFFPTKDMATRNSAHLNPKILVSGGVSGPCCSSWLCDSLKTMCDCATVTTFSAFQWSFCTKDMSSLNYRRCTNVLSIQGSGPFSTIGWIARTLGTQDTNETRYETFPWVCVKWFRYNWCNVIPINFMNRSFDQTPAILMSHCLCLFHMWRSCVRVFGPKPCAALRVEVCRWRGAGSGDLVEVGRCRLRASLAQFSQGATSDATETAQNLATLTRAAKCSRAEDRIKEFLQRIASVVTPRISISRGISPPN